MFLEEMTEEVGGPNHLLSGPNVQVRQIPLSTYSSVTGDHICCCVILSFLPDSPSFLILLHPCASIC